MTSGKVHLLIVTSMLTCASVVTQSYSDVEEVYSFVKTLSPPLRPVKNQSEILKVFVSFNLNAITKVDEVRQELTCNAWLNLSWTDQIRTWNKSDYGGLDLLHTDPTNIWRPRIIVTNSLQDRDIFKDAYSHINVYWDGRASWYPGGVFHTSCKMDMTIFPFDTHVCNIRFISNSYYTSELVFVATRGKAVYMSVVTDLLPQNSDSIPLMLVYLSSVLLLCSLALGLSIFIINIGDDNNDNNDNNASLHEKGGISKPATDAPDLFVTKQNLFSWERKADDNGKEEVTPVKQEADGNTKRNLCFRFVRIKGYILSIIFMGLWFLLSLVFLLCGIYL